MNRIVMLKFTTANYGRKKGDEAPPRQWCMRVWREKGNCSPPIRLYDVEGKPILVSSPLVKKLKPVSEKDYEERNTHPERYEKPEIAEIVDLASRRMSEQNGGEKELIKGKRRNGMTIDKAFAQYIDWFAIERTSPKTQTRNSQRLLEFFAGENINNISQERAREYADWLMTLFTSNGDALAKDTVRLYISAGSQLFTYLIDNNLYTGKNPFFGVWKYVLTKYKNRWVIEEEEDEEDSMTRTLTDEQHALLWNELQKPDYREAMIDWAIGCMTGLRETERIYQDEVSKEVTGLEMGEFNLYGQRLRYLRRKPTKLLRTIHIPKHLVLFMQTHCPGEGPVFSLTPGGIRLQLDKAAKAVGVKVTRKTTRKIFSNWFKDEKIGNGSEWALAVHQGRAAANVIRESYLSKNPIKVAKPVIDRMEPTFEKTFATPRRLRRVK